MIGGNEISLPVLKEKYSDKLSPEQTGGTYLQLADKIYIENLAIGPWLLYCKGL